MKVIATTISNVVRLVSFGVLGKTLFKSENVWAYVGVTVTCTVGSIIGSRLRGNFDTERILRCLYVVLILSTATMFDSVLNDGLALGLYVGGLIIFGVALTLVAWWKASVLGLTMTPRQWVVASAGRLAAASWCCRTGAGTDDGAVPSAGQRKGRPHGFAALRD